MIIQRIQADLLCLLQVTCDFHRNTGSDAAEQSSAQTCVLLQSSGHMPAGSVLFSPTQLSVTHTSVVPMAKTSEANASY